MQKTAKNVFIKINKMIPEDIIIIVAKVNGKKIKQNILFIKINIKMELACFHFKYIEFVPGWFSFMDYEFKIYLFH